MCEEQSSVSDSSTESEIISLDAALRLDGTPAHYLWDLIVSVLGNTTRNHDRTGRPVVCPSGGARQQQLIIEDDGTESDLSLRSRSFLDRVNDQVLKRQKHSSMNVTENDDKHSVIWWMFMSVTLEPAVFMGKNNSDNWHSIRNTKDLTMRQMFDISAKSVSEQDEIFGVKRLGILFVEVFVFAWWWTSHQSSAHKGLRLFRSCIVSW